MPTDYSKSPSKSVKLGKELLNACYFCNYPLAMKLIEKGADPSYTDPRDGWAGIHYAARWGKIRLIDALVKAGADINLKTTGKETALHKACRSDRKDVVVWMLRHGANGNAMNSDGSTPAQLTADVEIKGILEHFDDFLEKWKQEKRLGAAKHVGGSHSHSRSSSPRSGTSPRK
jgi:ankyrin repeat protein